MFKVFRRESNSVAEITEFFHSPLPGLHLDSNVAEIVFSVISRCRTEMCIVAGGLERNYSLRKKGFNQLNTGSSTVCGTEVVKSHHNLSHFKKLLNERHRDVLVTCDRIT